MQLDPNQKRFANEVLPRFLRRTPSAEGVLAVLYLKGISTNNFDSALKAIYGEGGRRALAGDGQSAEGSLEARVRGMAKASAFCRHYAYIWSDGVYSNARVEGQRSYVLVVICAKSNGEGELLVIGEGVRESETSWKELLLELSGQRVASDPSLQDGRNGHPSSYTGDGLRTGEGSREPMAQDHQVASTATRP